MDDAIYEKAVACPECGNIYDPTIARGCPLCGYNSPESGEMPRGGTYGGHKELVASIVDEHGPASMADIYQRYEDRVDDPRTRRTVRWYLQQLDREGEIDARGDKRGRDYAPA